MSSIASPRITATESATILSTRGVLSGGPLSVIPFGGSFSESDAVLGRSQQRTPVGNYMVHDVGAHLFSRNELIANLPQRDSLEITKDDLDHLINSIAQASSQNVVVTTGLNRIVEIARYLAANCSSACPDKAITVTGSHDFFSKHPGDAKFNLGYAMASRFDSTPGVRIAMHMERFHPEGVFIDLVNRHAHYLDSSRESGLGVFNPDLRIIGLGGTIEGQDSDIGARFRDGFCEPYIKQVIRPKRMPSAFTPVAIQADSRDLNDRNIEQLASTILSAKERQIVFTVGTFGAERVLDRLATLAHFTEALKRDDKTVIGVCALIHPNIQNSDAPYNLGFALGAAPLVESGLYLCAHGILAKAGTLTKDVLKDRFVLRDQ